MFVAATFKACHRLAVRAIWILASSSAEPAGPLALREPFALPVEEVLTAEVVDEHLHRVAFPLVRASASFTFALALASHKSSHFSRRFSHGTSPLILRILVIPKEFLRLLGDRTRRKLIRTFAYR